MLFSLWCYYLPIGKHPDPPDLTQHHANELCKIITYSFHAHPSTEHNVLSLNRVLESDHFSMSIYNRRKLVYITHFYFKCTKWRVHIRSYN